MLARSSLHATLSGFLGEEISLFRELSLNLSSGGVAVGRVSHGSILLIWSFCVRLSKDENGHVLNFRKYFNVAVCTYKVDVNINDSKFKKQKN